MLALALIVAASSATTATWVLLRRRRSRRGRLLAPPARPMPAGVHHLAARVSELSDLGLHLHGSRRQAGRPRVAVMLEQR